MPACVIAADIGGHTITLGLVQKDETGLKVLRKHTVPTPESRTLQAVCSTLCRLMTEQNAPADAPLALAVPSAVNKAGTLINCPNMQGWNGLNAADFEHLTGHSVVLANDCDCAAAGEMMNGAARGLTDFFYCTLGTGIGGSVIVNGKIVRGANGHTGELGHVPFMEQTTCGCGGRGHLESLFSADVLERAGEKCGYGTDMKNLWDHRENARLARYFATGMTALAAALTSVTHLLDPQAIVIGGGLSHLEGLTDDLRDYMFPLLSPACRPGPELRLAELGEDAPLLGAAGFALGTGF